MEFAARRFARWVLLIHLLVLAVVIAVVAGAGGRIYHNTRDLAVRRASERQGLLAAQTARGIESFYQGILDDMDLMRRGDEGEPAPALPALGPRGTLLGNLLWKQLEDRASHLFLFDRVTMKVIPLGSRDPNLTAQQIADQARDWLARLTQPAISEYQSVKRGGVTLVCEPLAERSRRILVAAVPGREVEDRFFKDLNEKSDLSATLVDEKLAIMASSNHYLLVDAPNRLGDLQICAMARYYIEHSRQGVDIVERPLKIGATTIHPSIITGEQVVLPAKKWLLFIATPLSDVDAVLGGMFRSILAWAAFVVVAMTAILVSTAIQLIRSRMRLERTRNEILHREVSHARQIQLAWLPDAATPASVDIIGVNQPATHISGDFYDWFDLPDGRTVVTIGDVTGHGIAAAFLMATAQLLVRNTMRRIGDPAECLSRVNRQLCQQAFNGQFVTMLIVVVDLKQSRIEAAAAGHPPPLIRQGDESEFWELTLEPNLVLGVEPAAVFRSARFAMQPRSSLLLFTDGVVEAESSDGRRFRVDGLRRSLNGSYPTAKALLDAAVAAVSDFRGHGDLADDLTLVAVRAIACSHNSLAKHG